MIDTTDLNQLEAPQLREMVRSLASSVVTRDREITFKQALIDKLTHENAVLKRLKFAAKSEAYSAEQKSLLEETLDMDLAAVAAEIEALQPERAPSNGKQQPKRAPLPAHLPRREVRHEPDDTTCGCGRAMQRIGEDVAEKLDYQPGVFTVERHIRGKWACACCERLVQAPVAAHVIDKGIPTTGLLAQVLVAKYLDHLPLYRQERVFERAGMAIALTPADARSIIASGRMAVFVGCESGFDHEGDTLVLEALYRLGLRTVQFATQTGFNAFADSATAPLQGGQAPVFYGGINDVGRKLVAKMNDLGILIDLTHGTPQTMAQVIAASRAPVVASHEVIRSVSGTTGITDDLIQSIAAKGGLVGIHGAGISKRYAQWAAANPAIAAAENAPVGAMIGYQPSFPRLPGDHGEYIARFDSELQARWQALNNFHEDASALPFLPTADEWAEHVNYVIKLVGADHVAIGLDMVPGRTGVLADATGYPDLIAALGRVTTADNIRKISGENYMRVFSQVQTA